jgi:hypothetical protein
VPDTLARPAKIKADGPSSAGIEEFGTATTLFNHAIRFDLDEPHGINEA